MNLQLLFPRRPAGRLLLFFTMLAAVGLTGAASASASPPDNDLFANAQVVASLPFIDSGELEGTTTEVGEPQACNFQAQSVWYSISPATATAVRMNLDGSSPGVVANVWRSFGGGIGSLGLVACIGGGSTQFTVQAGETYYIQAGSVSSRSAHLQLNLQDIPPPANDDFANATQITRLPFFDSTDRSSAGTESGEPLFPSCGPISHTVWYSYTAAETQSLHAHGSASGANSFIAVYTGDSLSTLSPVSCGSERNVFKAVAGTTYYIQVGSFDGQAGAPQVFRLDVAPAPSVTPIVGTSQPSIFDSVQFFASVFDPVGFGTVESYRWEFGDGATSDGCCPVHRYTADGDYTAEVTITTSDGRTATGSTLVDVKTHDVAITKLAAPQSATPGQQKTITVSVLNKRYAETVQMQLSKSVPGGFVPVGLLTLSVPAGKAIDFKFTYVFTDEDRAVGKVSFQATATLVGARDALPADNSITALATRVR